LNPKGRRQKIAAALLEARMQLALATWMEVETYLKDSRGIIIPIGSTEQHGPNGLIGTDALCAEVIARGVGDKTGALVAPTISVGMAQHHLGFPGSITLRPSTLIQVVVDNVQSLARHGFDRFFFVNGHGGNIATVTAAFSEIYATRSLDPRSNAPGLRCKLRNWWAGPRVAQLDRELYGDSAGSHATPAEVAVTQFAFPQAIKSAKMEPKVAPKGEFYDADDYRSRFADGRIGSDPSLATPEGGKRFFDTAVEEISADYAKFLAA
jgi:creatinine amidohydrolase